MEASKEEAAIRALEAAKEELAVLRKEQADLYASLAKHRDTLKLNALKAHLLHADNEPGKS